MRKSAYSNEIAAVVKKFLEEDDWNYSFDEKTGNFDFGLCDGIVGSDRILEHHDLL